MSKKTIVFGKNSQIGIEFSKLTYFRNDFIYFSSKTIFKGLSCNLLRYKDISKIIKIIKPKNIIILSAYTDVDQAEKENDLCYNINAEAIKNICIASEKYKSNIIYISTDFVFEGKIKKALNEKEICRPINFYGYSKYLGEKLINQYSSKYLILRTSSVYSKYKKNFVTNIIQALINNKKIYVVNDQFNNPTPADLIAKVILFILDSKFIFKKNVFHLSTNGFVNKYQISKFIRKKIIKLNPKLKLAKIFEKKSKDEVPRPVYSVLDCTLIQKKLDIKLSDWDEYLENFINDYEF